MFVFQVFENVGMTMGIMPITGIPLPFMSYGGSGTLTAFVAMGLVLNVHMRRFTLIARGSDLGEIGGWEAGCPVPCRTMVDVWARLEPHLASVQKPARYIGCELGAEVPAPAPGRVGWLLALPGHLRDRAARTRACRSSTRS